MKSMQKPIRSFVSLSVVTMMASHTAHAGAFSLYTEGSAAAIGNFAAGIAAEGADAAIGWYNPAGLVLIKDQQLVLSGVGVFPSNQISGTSIFNTSEDGFSLPPYVQSFNNLQGAKSAAVPALHYAMPLGENLGFGFSVTSPFGLSTSWLPTSPVRYSATFTELMTMDVSPELGGKLTDNFAVGAGLDFQFARVKFNSVVGAPSFVQTIEHLPPTFLDTLSRNKGDSLGMGFHAGVLGLFNDNHTRVGANYQSKVGHTFEGDSVFTGRLANDDPTSLVAPSAAFTSNQLISNDVEFPDVLTVSAYQDVNNKLALLGSVVYTGWSVFQKIQLSGVAAVSPETGAPGTVSATTIENYRDTWRFAVGANYRVTDQWMMRFGGGFDQTPTVNAERDIRLPDVDRWALAIGAHYQARYNVGFDVGYAYLFAANNASPINKVTPIGTMSTNTILATARDHAQLVGLQVVWLIDQKAPVTTK